MAKIVSKIIQISDLHMFGDLQTSLLGINTYFSFTEVVTDMTMKLSSFRPDFVFLTGDVSQDFSKESYEIVSKFLLDLPGQFAAILGNHDDPMMFSAHLHFKNTNRNKFFITNDWKIILLNSHWPDHVAGRLAIEELEFLHKELKSGIDKNILIFLHHQVLPVDSVWIDKIGLTNAQQFLDIIDGYDNIRAVVSGHVHQEVLKKRNDVEFITTPSTSWQFAAFSRDFGVDNLMPGYRRFELYDDGSFKTEVIRLPYNERFIPDKSSRGY